MQKSISAFFPQDTSPAAVGMRERMRQAAETNRRIMEEEAARAEQRELEAIAAEQREFEQAKQRRTQAREAQRAAEKRKRMKDLEKRLCGYGELIPNKLYLGNAVSAENEEWILDAKITGVVNCTPDIPCYFERDNSSASRQNNSSDPEGEDGQVISYENSSGECVIAHPHPEYLRIPVCDSVNDSLCKYFPSAAEFIGRHIAAGGTVLVHCREGKSRSATIAAMYLMKAKKMKLKEALEFISENAWTPSINLTFLKELMGFEVELYPELSGKSSAEEAREDRESRPEMIELHPGMSEKDLKRMEEQKEAYEKRLARKRTLRANKGKEFFPVPIDPAKECTGVYSIFAKYIKPSDEQKKTERSCTERSKSPEKKNDDDDEVSTFKCDEMPGTDKGNKEEEKEGLTEANRDGGRTSTNKKKEVENKDEAKTELESKSTKKDLKTDNTKDESIVVEDEEKEKEAKVKPSDNGCDDKKYLDKSEKEDTESKNTKTRKRKAEKTKGEEKETEEEEEIEPKKKRGKKRKTGDKGTKVQSRLESFFG